jgi:DNA-binding NarL/FixJ family response regulator
MDRTDAPLVLVVDDHPLVRDALVQVLQSPGAGLACVAVGSAGQARLQLESPRAVAAVLADFRLPDGDGVSLLLEARRLKPRVACVLLSGMEDARLPARARHLGFDGYLSKALEPLQIVAAVRAVLQGRPCFPSPVAQAGLPALTDRQAEVLALVGQGRSNKEIARALGVSERTVKDHLTIVFARLAVGSRAEAVARAGALGLIALS